MVNARIWCSTALPEGLNTNAKLRDSTAASVSLNKNLLKIYQWVYQWKMILNPDVLKHTQKTVFSRKAIFFFYLGYLSRTFTNHRTEGGGYLFNSSLPLPPASQTIRH